MLTDKITVFVSKIIEMLEIVTIRTSFNAIKDDLSKKLNAKVEGFERITDREGIVKLNINGSETFIPVFLTKKGRIINLLRYIKNRGINSDVILISPIACLEGKSEEVESRRLRYLVVIIPGNKLREDDEKLINEEINEKISEITSCKSPEIVSILDFWINQLAYEQILIADTIQNLSEMIGELAEMVKILSERMSLLESFLFGKTSKEEEKESIEDGFLFT